MPGATQHTLQLFGIGPGGPGGNQVEQVPSMCLLTAKMVKDESTKPVLAVKTCAKLDLHPSPMWWCLTSPEPVPAGQMVQRSQLDKDPNGKSLRHFGAVSDTECSVEPAVPNRTPFDYFPDEKLKFALKNLTPLEKKIQHHNFGDQASDWTVDLDSKDPEVIEICSLAKFQCFRKQSSLELSGVQSLVDLLQASKAIYNDCHISGIKKGFHGTGEGRDDLDKRVETRRVTMALPAATQHKHFVLLKMKGWTGGKYGGKRRKRACYSRRSEFLDSFSRDVPLYFTDVIEIKFSVK
ncbi:hypothetical protein WISP_132914 [Willisornis vidua]|uniref:Uncharacterized protein n=1 Tax=Willisornis vidua TaxID=1566151 RepID=A0ABQ9CV15_9PASS|nr:hypothetical protein WISP_132914 [Willisornis vidua]